MIIPSFTTNSHKIFQFTTSLSGVVPKPLDAPSLDTRKRSKSRSGTVKRNRDAWYQVVLLHHHILVQQPHPDRKKSSTKTTKLAKQNTRNRNHHARQIIIRLETPPPSQKTLAEQVCLTWLAPARSNMTARFAGGTDAPIGVNCGGGRRSGGDRNRSREEIIAEEKKWKIASGGFRIDAIGHSKRI